MKYTELYKKRWDGTVTNESEFLASIDFPSKKAWLAIKVLDGIKGFDHWRCDMDDDCKNKIFDDLKAVLA